ncbi:DNA repair exonuclease [Acuticoccus sp. M5D2P5]|uniref:metallophosphoesterase family protein n=1 Tax=Acuticoccus kalidii TaxID=2910977 RepID=UPI001F48A901|nr:DNA repair exonuclease [Acuticoccus kalidii]MCF3934721.1 DNA repair exonuclease [Acuticoccus kalidii]
MAFRFLHTGDLHLDSPLTGLGAFEGDDADKAKRIAGAGRAAFVDLVDMAIERRVDAVLIAGDLWDGSWRDVSAGLFVQRETGRLARAGIRTFAILGNHDAENSVTDRIRDIDAIHLFGSGAASSVDCGGAVIHGQSYARAATVENLAARYPARVPGRINIGLLHTALDGSMGHANYAPCTLADLSARQYDYWALGHVHTRRILQDKPAAEGGAIAFCGVLQGRHIRETGPKGFYFGEVDEAGVRLEPVDLPHVAWFLAEIEVGAKPADEAIRTAIAEVAADLSPALECAVVRVVLTGETDQHFRLANSRRALVDQARFAALGVDGRRILVEDVTIATRPPSDAVIERLPHHFETLIAQAAKRPEVAETAAAEIGEILNRLPQEVKERLLERAPEFATFDASGELGGPLSDAVGALAARIADA